jgi:uncharacterized protein YbjT (DUF2867 family)
MNGDVMRIVIFGATGMVGRGVLEACLRDDAITGVLVLGRSPTQRIHPKLREIHHEDFTDVTRVQARLSGYDACFFCLGTSSLGMTEAAYRRVTYDFTLAAARALLSANPDLTFCYVSGAGADGTGKTRMMWARVRGETENALLAMTPRAYVIRPAFILPLSGTRSRTRIYRVLTPFYPVLRRLGPRHVTTSLRLGQAMIKIARCGADRRILTTSDINDAVLSPPSEP